MFSGLNPCPSMDIIIFTAAWSSWFRKGGEPCRRINCLSHDRLCNIVPCPANRCDITDLHGRILSRTLGGRRRDIRDDANSQLDRFR